MTVPIKKQSDPAAYHQYGASSINLAKDIFVLHSFYLVEYVLKNIYVLAV